MPRESSPSKTPDLSTFCRVTPTTRSATHLGKESPALVEEPSVTVDIVELEETTDPPRLSCFGTSGLLGLLGLPGPPGPPGLPAVLDTTDLRSSLTFVELRFIGACVIVEARLVDETELMAAVDLGLRTDVLRGRTARFPSGNPGPWVAAPLAVAAFKGGST